ncbi:MAG: hypothetical protein U1E89_19715 [Burkholderiaceae bacterium]
MHRQEAIQSRCSAIRRLAALAVVTAASFYGCGGGSTDSASAAATGACAVRSIEKLVQGNFYLSPDGSRYAENRPDAGGIYQVYVGTTASGSAVCITCAQSPGGPKPGAQKFMVVWHPSGEWLFVGGEIDHVRSPFITAETDLALMQSGINLDMYVTRPDGTAWTKLSDFKDSGYTGPAIAPDGSLYYAQIVDGNVFAYSFGRWVLKRSTFVVDAAGVPSLANTTDLTPPDTHWVEPGNVTPDGKYLVLTLDTGLAPNKASGMDQWLLELATGRFINLTSSPKEWDEHGLFSPNGKKIVFMSSKPYPDYDASTALFGLVGLKAEIMMMDVDGSNLVQLTHFGQTGYPESSPDSIASLAYFSADGTKLYALQFHTGARFPNQDTWVLTFAGRCGS